MSIILECRGGKLEVPKEFPRQCTFYNNMIEDTGEDPDTLPIESFSIEEIKFIYDLFQILNTATIEDIPLFEYIAIDNMENNFIINYVNKGSAPSYTGNLVGAYESFSRNKELFNSLDIFMMFTDTIHNALVMCNYIQAVENNDLHNFQGQIHQQIKEGKSL